MKPKKVCVLPCKGWFQCLLATILIHSCFTMENGLDHSSTYSAENLLKDNNNDMTVIPVIYDSTSSVDGNLQSDLAKAAFLSLTIIEKGVSPTDRLKPVFLDLSSARMEECIKIVKLNKVHVLISLLGSEQLITFANFWEGINGHDDKLYIYTPRSFFKSQWKSAVGSIVVKSLQMSEEARAVALMNRVNKVGVNTLIPVLDSDSEAELDILSSYSAIGNQKITFTKPIFLNSPEHEHHFKMVLKENVGFNENRLKVHPHNHSSLSFDNKSMTVVTAGQHERRLKPGILLLAKSGSKLAITIATERKHLLLDWFSPNIIEFQDKWSCNNNNNNNNNSATSTETHNDTNRITDFQSCAGGPVTDNTLFGLYTVSFVGAKGWDNPDRRNVLREMATFTESSPKILLSILTFDAAKLASDHLKNPYKLHFPTNGLSGLIEFEGKFRKSGIYMGSSLVPQNPSLTTYASLLQPSIWILEDMVTIKQHNIKSLPKISDYEVATSSILTKEELLKIAESVEKKMEKCGDHLLRIVVFDVFTQLPHRYFFTPENLPGTLVIPNTQGFGITLACTHKDTSGHFSTLRLACTPGVRLSQPINCFRSHVAIRQKRDVGGDGEPVPSVQYQYGFSNDPWNDGYYQNQGLKNRDYQAPPPDNSYAPPGDSATAGPPPPPPPPPPPSKLPELRQILKAAKPFVGSCIGSTTGCAMCVLVLGRLPLGTAPPACTGPCFVGTFGSCGSLLGRVFSETTVICTELFRQGLLDVETFVADAEFGKYMHQASPYTMKGYTLLATPLVENMKSSKGLTKVVAWFAIPWAQHMQYLLGRTDDTNLIGKLVHLLGYPICNLTGRLYMFYFNFTNFYLATAILPFILTILLFLILSPTVKNLSGGSSRLNSNIFQSFLTVYAVISSRSIKLVLQKFSGRVNNYFKAIGSST